MISAFKLPFPRESADAILNSGFELLKSGELERAATIFEGLMAIDPEDTAAMGAMGAVREAQHRVSEALQFYERALALAPDDAFSQRRHSELRRQA